MMPHIHFKKAKSKSPLIISCPHAGTVIPKEVHAQFATLDQEIILCDGDLFVQELYQNAPELGCDFLYSDISRTVVDLNRDKNDVNAFFLQGASKKPDAKNLGLIPHKNTHHQSLLKKPLSQSEFEQRIKNYYDPFHDQLQKMIQETKQEFGYCLHIDAHSMPSKGTTAHTDAGNERADVVPGDVFGKSCGGFLTDCIESVFKNHGYSVERNNPYSGLGGFITRHYGNPQQNVHSIMIELNRKQYMDESAFKIIPEKFKKLQEAIEEMVSAVQNLKIPIA